MNETNDVKWSLDTLTNVTRINTEKLLKLDLEGRQIAIFPKADDLVGASFYDAPIMHTSNEFPMHGNAGIIKSARENDDKICFEYKDFNGKNCVFTPEPTDIVFIIERDDDAKTVRYLKPEYGWRPDKGSHEKRK